MIATGHHRTAEEDTQRVTGLFLYPQPARRTGCCDAACTSQAPKALGKTLQAREAGRYLTLSSISGYLLNIVSISQMLMVCMCSDGDYNQAVNRTIHVSTNLPTSTYWITHHRTYICNS